MASFNTAYRCLSVGRGAFLFITAFGIYNKILRKLGWNGWIIYSSIPDSIKIFIPQKLMITSQVLLFNHPFPPEFLTRNTYIGTYV